MILLMFMQFLCLLVTIAGWANMTTIIVLSLLVPLGWSIYLRKMDNFHQEIADIFQRRILSASNEMVVFGCVGVLAVILDGVDLSNQISYLFGLAGNNLWLIKWGLCYIPWLLSLVGIVPLVTLAALATLITPELLNASPFYFAYLLLGAYGMGYAATPFSAISMLIARLTGLSSWKIGLKWNITYVLLFPPLFLLLLDVLNI